MSKSQLDWARSAKGAFLELHSGGENHTRNAAPILIVGGVHGDEPEGVWLAEHALEWLKATEVPCAWFLVPCLNPDGYQSNQRVNGNGVDLNRNFPARNWSPKYEQDRYFPGPNPASEPEVQALVKLIQEIRPQLIIHCHSWHPCIVYTGKPALPFAEFLGESSGYAVKEDIGYPTPGSLGEYGWKDCQIPVICIEEAERVKRETVWPRFQQGFERLFARGATGK